MEKNCFVECHCSLFVFFGRKYSSFDFCIGKRSSNELRFRERSYCHHLYNRCAICCSSFVALGRSKHSNIIHGKFIENDIPRGTRKSTKISSFSSSRSNSTIFPFLSISIGFCFVWEKEHRLDHHYQRTMETERRKIINKKQSFGQMDVQRSSLLRDVFFFLCLQLVRALSLSKIHSLILLSFICVFFVV